MKSYHIVLIVFALAIIISLVAIYNIHKQLQMVLQEKQDLQARYNAYKIMIQKSEYYTKVSEIIWGKESRRCDAGLILKVERIRQEIDDSLSLDLILSLIAIESGFNKYAISKAGAVGLMQILPTTAKLIDTTITDSSHLYDEEKNLQIGIKYLSLLRKRFDSVDLALLAYNRGPSRVMAEIVNKNLPSGYKDKINKYKSEFR